MSGRIHVLPSFSKDLVFGQVLLEDGYPHRIELGTFYTRYGITQLAPDTVRIAFKQDESGVLALLWATAEGTPFYAAGHECTGRAHWTWSDSVLHRGLGGSPLRLLPAHLADAVGGWAAERIGDRTWTLTGEQSG